MSKASDHTEDGFGRQTVRDLIDYLSDVDCAEGMTITEVLDLPITFLTGHDNGFDSILSTYVSDNIDGTKSLYIDLGE